MPFSSICPDYLLTTHNTSAHSPLQVSSISSPTMSSLSCYLRQLCLDDTLVIVSDDARSPAHPISRPRTARSRRTNCRLQKFRRQVSQQHDKTSRWQPEETKSLVTAMCRNQHQPRPHHMPSDAALRLPIRCHSSESSRDWIQSIIANLNLEQGCDATPRLPERRPAPPLSPRRTEQRASV